MVSRCFKGNPPNKSKRQLFYWKPGGFDQAIGLGQSHGENPPFSSSIPSSGAPRWSSYVVLCESGPTSSVQSMCVCIYIYTHYTYASLIYLFFQLYVFLPLCFPEPSPPVSCQERSWWNCILGWRHCICSCWMARAKIVGMPRGLRAGLHEEKP